MSIKILGIESSCDDTSAAVITDRIFKSNVIANQQVHQDYGGVVPELASRAHQQNIIPVVDQALEKAGISGNEVDAVAFTRGPGLLGSLLVGTSFAKGFALAHGIPLIEVNHLQAHILALFIRDESQSPEPTFPFLCLLVSGGHTQLVIVEDFLRMKIIGNTIDDAAGEAFDKCAKIMGLPYPGGPYVDKLARQGNPSRFSFNKPTMDGYNYSFSGLKTSFLYFVRDQLKKDRDFISKNREDLAASLQKTIIEILLSKLKKAASDMSISQVALAGGVSANSGLREALTLESGKRNWEVFIPRFSYTTDNAAMIAITGYFKYLNREFSPDHITPLARMHF